jgi:hypothetical protein
MPVIFGMLICDDENCSGALDIEGVCIECGKVVDPIPNEQTEPSAADKVQESLEFIRRHGE